MLFNYMKSVQRFIRDSGQRLIDPGDLSEYVNTARRQVAMQAQCVRILPSIQNGIKTIDVISGGTNYTDPTVSISLPDFPSAMLPSPSGLQATAIATQAGGSIIGVNVDVGGSGYFQPEITIVDPTGSGASVVAHIAPINQTNTNQEVYNFSDVDLSAFPGVDSILAIKSISIIYSNYRYTLPYYSFTTYQSMIRQYPLQYYYVPVMWSQYGQGAGGSVYAYPIASQPYQWDWDCICLPSDLTSDNDVEAIPMPWTDAVKYLATHFAFLELQNLNAADYYMKLFLSQINRFSVAARPGRMNNPYGRF